MNKRNFLFFNKVLLFVFVFLFSALNALSCENSISGINVQQLSGEKYKILLKLDKNVNIKKTLNGNNNLTLILNKTVPSDSIEIVYDNAEDIENVMVQRKNSDNTVILFQGMNIADSEIFVKDLSTGVIQKTENNNKSFLFVSNKKFVLFSILGMVFFYLVMLISRPKEKIYSENNTKKIVKAKHIENINTLRGKNLVQSGYVPSISYKVNGSFSSINHYVSIPRDFNENINIIDEEIRKVG